MPKAEKRNHIIKNENKREKVGAGRRRSTGNNVLKDSEILVYKKGHEKVANPVRIQGSREPKDNENFDKNKEAVSHQVGSIFARKLAGGSCTSVNKRLWYKSAKQKPECNY